MSNFSAQLFKAASGAESRPISKARSYEPFESPVFEEYMAKNDISGYMSALWKGVEARDIESLRVLFYLAVQDEEVEDATDLLLMLYDDTDDDYARMYFRMLKDLEIDKMTPEQQDDIKHYRLMFKRILCLADMAYEQTHPGYLSPFSRFGDKEPVLLRGYLNNVGRQNLPEPSEEVLQGHFKDCAPEKKKDYWRSLYYRDDCSSNQQSIYEDAKIYACQGDPYAMYIVGYLLAHSITTKYDHPPVVILPADRDEALRWLQRAAKANVPEAQWEVARLWINREEDFCKDEGMRYIRRGVELGNRDCIRYIVEHSDDPEERFRHLSMLVEMDNTYQSQLQLAECYEKGIGCAKDEKKAFELVEYVYKHSSCSPYDSSYEDATRMLRRYLNEGIGCEKDPDRAWRVYQAYKSDEDDMWELLTR